MWKQYLKAEYGKGNGFSHYAVLRSYTLLGEKEKALEALEEAYKSREFLLPFVNADPLFDHLRPEPRFQGVFRRMGLTR